MRNQTFFYFLSVTMFSVGAHAQSAPATSPSVPPRPVETTPVQTTTYQEPAPIPTTYDYQADRFRDIGGFEIGLRASYAFPNGKIQQGLALSDIVDGQVGGGIDIGYRASPIFYIGAFANLGYAVGAAIPVNSGFDVCSDASGYSGSCTGYDMRAGIDIKIHPLRSDRLDPWVGVGLGYELGRIALKGNAVGVDINASTLYHGPLSKFEAGFNYRLTPFFKMGPFVGITLAQYLYGKTEFNGNELSSGSVKNAKLHQWFDLGVQGSFNL